MELNQIVNKFNNNPKYLSNGAGKLARRWNCTKEDIYEARKIIRGEKQVTKRLPKVLIFDIESSPSITYTFGRFKVNIGIDQVIQDPLFLTWSAKWLYSSEIIHDKITQEEVLEADDYRIVKSLWNLVDEADIVIAHYGDNFDIPMLNYRAIINGLNPFSSVKSVDTKKVASMVFKFPSNKLDALAGYFGVGHKIKTDFELWKRCLNGEEDAITEMDVYCQQDVKILEDVYLRLRPYVKAHPNLAVYNDLEEIQCSMCGSTDLTPEGYYYTNTSKYDQYRCSCGALTRGRINLLTKNKKKNLLTSIPR